MLPIATTDLRKNNERRQWCVRKDLMQVDHYVRMIQLLNSLFHFNSKIVEYFICRLIVSKCIGMLILDSERLHLYLRKNDFIDFENRYTFFLFVWLLIAWKWPLDPVSRPRMVFRCNFKHTNVRKWIRKHAHIYEYCFGPSFLLS